MQQLDRNKANQDVYAMMDGYMFAIAVGGLVGFVGMLLLLYSGAF